MLKTTTASNISAPTQFVNVGDARYAYRRFGPGSTCPLLCLQHFTGNLDNWDPAVTDPLASGREVILFDNAGIGRSTGKAPQTIDAMAEHALAFMDGLRLERCDILGYSLGGMFAQHMALERPSLFRRLILAGTAPRGGEDIMHLEKPSLASYFQDPALQGYARLQGNCSSLRAHRARPRARQLWLDSHHAAMIGIKRQAQKWLPHRSPLFAIGNISAAIDSRICSASSTRPSS